MSLISTYNSIKNLLVTKLINKGITNASTSQGMTTLINKIDDIETTIPTTLTADFSGTYPPNVDVPFDVMLKSNFTNDDNVSINAPLVGADIDFYIDNTLDDTIATNNNGLSSYVLNISEKDTYTIKAKFEESVPFAGAIISGTVTIFESIIKYLQNISFSNSDGTNSREIIYGNNQSVTMTVQSFEEDGVTVSKGSQVDYMKKESGSEILPYSPDLDNITKYVCPYNEYSIVMEGFETGYVGLVIGDITVSYYEGNNYYIVAKYGNHGTYSEQFQQSSNILKIKDFEIYDGNNSIEIGDNSNNIHSDTNLYKNEIVCFARNNKLFFEDFIVIDTKLNDNQGYTSYEYEAQGVGEVYIKAQSHDDPTIQTDPYLISDWVKKDFTGVGNWIAFTGRVNTFSSNTNDVFTQGNGSKGGVHSQNTVFHLPNDDYVVSFKIANGTIGIGVRVGLHSATYDDHHEKAVIGIENDSSGGFKFDHSTSEVTTVTKVTTGVTKLNTDDLIEFKVIDDTVTFYINGTSYGSATLDWLHTPIWLYGQSWSTNNGNFSIKEFRVKRI